MQYSVSARPVHGGNITWAASLAGCPPSLIVDFSASINPLGPPPSAIAAIQTALPLLRDYPDPHYHSLRIALGQAHQIDPDWILPGNGSAELLTWASRELAELPTTWILTPAFGDYRRALKAFDADIHSCPLSLDPRQNSLSPPFSPSDYDDAYRQTYPRDQGLLLNNPHNPTGKLFRQEDILACLRDFALVVVDEAFMDFLPPDQQQSVIPWIAEHPNLVVLRSLTKFYSLPGLRLGYAIAHPDRLHRWQQWRDPWSVNTLAVAAAEAMMQDHAFQQRTWNWLPQTRTHLFQGLQALPGVVPHPGSANFLLVRSDQSVVELQRQLLIHHHLLIRDCLSFPELGDHYFRIAVRFQEENQRLLEGLLAVILSMI